MQGDRDAPAGRGQQGDAAGLGRAHHRAHVVLAEDPLDRDRVGLVPLDPLLDAGLDRDQPVRDRQVTGGADHTDVDQLDRPADRAVDHAHPAPGQTGIDPQHAHAASVAVRTPVRTTLTARGAGGGRDAPGIGRSTAGSRVERLHDLVGHVEVREHVLHVVEVLEGLEQAEHLAGAVAVELDLHRRHERRVGGVVVDAGGLQRRTDVSLGSGGRAIPRTVHHFLQESDVILGMGCSFTPSDFATAMPAGKRVIHATLDPAHLDTVVQAEIGLIGDAALTLDALLAAVDELVDGDRDATAVAAEIKQVHDDWMVEWLPILTSDEKPLTAYRVIWELKAATDPGNTIITHDAGSPRDQLSPFWTCTEPLSYLGWGKTTQLGYGLGLVMGAKLVHPDKLCVNLWGDAAIGFTGLELETCVRERIPVLSILFNNSHMAMETNAMGLSQRKFGTMEISGDYTAMAQSLGLYAEKVTDPDEVAGAIRRGIEQTEAGRPVLLEFITSRELRTSTHGNDTYMSPVPDNFRSAHNESEISR